MRKHTRKTVLQLSLLSSALLLAAPVALAQDSGLGTDLHFGTALDPSGGTALLGCDPDGATWLTAQRKRTPTGFLYPCPPAWPEFSGDGPWRHRGSVTLGYIGVRSEEHTSELQSLMRISSAVFC